MFPLHQHSSSLLCHRSFFKAYVETILLPAYLQTLLTLLLICILQAIANQPVHPQQPPSSAYLFSICRRPVHANPHAAPPLLHPRSPTQQLSLQARAACPLLALISTFFLGVYQACDPFILHAAIRNHLHHSIIPPAPLAPYAVSPQPSPHCSPTSHAFPASARSNSLQFSECCSAPFFRRRAASHCHHSPSRLDWSSKLLHAFLPPHD